MRLRKEEMLVWLCYMLSKWYEIHIVRYKTSYIFCFEFSAERRVIQTLIMLANKQTFKPQLSKRDSEDGIVPNQGRKIQNL